MTADGVPCAIVGGGPAGVVLAHLLARAGVEVVLLEARRNFDREFRGDAIFAWTMELLDQLGLAQGLLTLPHQKVRGYTYLTDRGSALVTDYTMLNSRFAFATALPQARLLDYITAQTTKYGHFRLEMGAPVTGLLIENGRVSGVRYRQAGEERSLRALLTIGADGRSSHVRKLGSFIWNEPFPPQFDVLWFRLPRRSGDGDDFNQRSLFGRGFYVSFIDRIDHWQVAYTIPKGRFAELRAAGLPAFRQSIADLQPALADRLAAIDDWSQIRLLPVRMNYVRRWCRPGLLLIGDAAHVMSSIGGVGIMCAMQDAVEAANVLAEPLRRGRVSPRDLARVQRRRGVPTRIMQFLQFLAEKQYVGRALNPDRPFRMPLSFRLPGVKRLLAYVTAYGTWPVHLRLTLPIASQPSVGGK